jgi:hypothetical protein
MQNCTVPGTARGKRQTAAAAAAAAAAAVAAAVSGPAINLFKYFLLENLIPMNTVPGTVPGYDMLR